MNQLIPGIGEYVVHHTGNYFGKVVGYGQRLSDEGTQLTLKVGMPSRLVSTRVIIIEDTAANWLYRMNSF